VIGSDETGARVAGKTAWHWVFQTPEASYHLIAPSRGGEVIDAFLAGAEPDVWGSDLWAPQVGTAAGAHQICHSHQARDLTFAAEADPDNERIWALDLRHLFGRAIRLHHERTQVTPATFARRRLLIEKATDRLVFDRYVAPKTEAARLQQRYRARRDSLYVFLHRDDVEPDLRLERGRVLIRDGRVEQQVRRSGAELLEGQPSRAHRARYAHRGRGRRNGC
jgi:hypothetical protein